MCVVMRIEYDTSLKINVTFVKSNHMCVQKTNCSTPAVIGQQTSTHGVDFLLGLIVFRVTLH